MINHLKQNSLKVKVGRQGEARRRACRVRQQRRCPRLRTCTISCREVRSILLPAQFDDYIADGKLVANRRTQEGAVGEERSGLG